ncbi:hypothetical protein pb186bvf_000854 [Paramecium bursaria]
MIIDRSNKDFIEIVFIQFQKYIQEKQELINLDFLIKAPLI